MTVYRSDRVLYTSRRFIVYCTRLAGSSRFSRSHRARRGSRAVERGAYALRRATVGRSRFESPRTSRLAVSLARRAGAATTSRRAGGGVPRPTCASSLLALPYHAPCPLRPLARSRPAPRAGRRPDQTRAPYAHQAPRDDARLANCSHGTGVGRWASSRIRAGSVSSDRTHRGHTQTERFRVRSIR